MRQFYTCFFARRLARAHKATAIVTTVAALGLWLITLASEAAPPTPGFKNLQVLPEDATSGEVFEVMKLITRALGTECQACHLTADRDFDSDARALKLTARAMMHLEQARRPNLSWRNPPATLCIECHQGQLRPANLPTSDNS